MQHDQARRTSIAIVGAGIGGLTRRRACCVPDLTCMFTDKQVGSVKSALASTLARMRRAFCIDWGSPKNLKKNGIEPASFDQWRWDDGRVLLPSPLGEEVEAAFGAPNVGRRPTSKSKIH